MCARRIGCIALQTSRHIRYREQQFIFYQLKRRGFFIRLNALKRFVFPTCKLRSVLRDMNHGLRIHRHLKPSTARLTSQTHRSRHRHDKPDSSRNTPRNLRLQTSHRTGHGLHNGVTLGSSRQHFSCQRSRNLITQPGKLRSILAILPVSFGLHFFRFLSVFNANFGLEIVDPQGFLGRELLALASTPERWRHPKDGSPRL